MLPNPDILNNYGPGKFVLSNLAAKRAKQLREGAPPLVQVDSPHPLTIALAEIAAGKIKPIMSESIELGYEEELTVLLDDTVPAELGMLLPSLDEIEGALIESEVEDEHDADVEPDEEISLADLVDEEGTEVEEEVEVVESEDDTLSLSDIADQENSDEDTEEEAL
jgi:DNA-directed RNA polymerase subunit omega